MHGAVPPSQLFSYLLLPGSVIVILFALAVSCYLVFGCLYRRIVVGAKGMDQVPNLEFWQVLTPVLEAFWQNSKVYEQNCIPSIISIDTLHPFLIGIRY